MTIEIKCDCKICHKPINREQLRVAPRLALTWTEGRNGGGQHGLILPEYLDEWAHQECVMAAKSRKTGQRSFL